MVGGYIVINFYELPNQTPSPLPEYLRERVDEVISSNKPVIAYLNVGQFASGVLQGNVMKVGDRIVLSVIYYGGVKFSSVLITVKDGEYTWRIAGLNE